MAAVLLSLAGSGCSPAHPEWNDLVLLDLLATAFAVTTTSPADGATGVATTTSISATFASAANASTLTTNTGGGSCSGSLQLSGDNFSTCIQMASAPTASSGNTVFTVTPLAALAATTSYHIRITTDASDANGNALAEVFTTTTGFTTGTADVTPPTVSGTTPADAATGLATSTTIAVTFNEAMDPSTVTTNTAGTACTGSIQVSSDGFTTCIQMTAAPVGSSGNTVFTVTPNAALAVSTTYRIRVTTAVTDTSANNLAGVFTTATGFTTLTPDVTPPTVSGTNPADTATAIATGTTVAVTFNEGMNPATLTTNTAGTACSGSFQVSSDGFTTCIQMTAAPAGTVGNTVFTVTPSAALANATTYRIRITTAVTDVAGNNLAGVFTTATGFTTAAANKRIFITATTTAGDMGHAGGGGGKAAADALCMADANYPGAGTFKAMIVTTTGAPLIDRRIASISANAGDGQVDWVFAASTTYYRLDATTAIVTTDANGIFVFGTLTNSFGGAGTTYRTGLSTDWTTTTRHCSEWDSSASGGGVANQGDKGIGNATDTTSITGAGGSPQCDQLYALLCVEQ